MLTEDEKRLLRRAIANEVSFLEDNGYRHRIAGDEREADDHAAEAAKWQVIKEKLEL